MKTKEIKSYAEKHIEAIKTLTNPSLMNLDIDIIHQWRIEVKKLKALMRMLDTISSDFSFKKNYKKISPVYQLLGGIREIQLQLAQAKGQHKGFWEKYKLLLEKEMNEKQDRFLHKLDTPLSKMLDKIADNMAKAIKNILAKDIKAYFEKQAKRIRKKIDKLDFTDPLALHALRKEVKDYGYNAKLDEKTATDALAKYSLTSDLFENVQKQLGEWHDLDIWTQRMKQREYALLLQNGETETFLNFTTGLEVEKDILKNKLIRMLGKG